MIRSAPVDRSIKITLAILVLSGGVGFWLPATTVADEGDSVPTENQQSDPAAPQAGTEQPATPADKSKPADNPAKNAKKRNVISDFFNQILTPGNRRGTSKKAEGRQPPRSRPPIKDPREKTPGTKNTDPRIPDTRTLRKAMQEARLSIEKRQWKIAVQQLQRILDVPEDAFTGGKGRVWTSLKDEAQLLLGSLPDEELRTYRAAYDGVASKRLAAGVAAGDFYEIVSVARQYFHTASGQQAADIVASHYLDRGEFGLADRWFKALIQSQADVIQTATLASQSRLGRQNVWPKRRQGTRPPFSVEVKRR